MIKLANINYLKHFSKVYINIAKINHTKRNYTKFDVTFKERLRITQIEPIISDPFSSGISCFISFQNATEQLGSSYAKLIQT